MFASVEQMLSDVALDAIDIAAPRATHADICRKAAQRGIAILCQKPLAPTLAEADRLVTDVGGRVPLMVHENWRFRPGTAPPWPGRTALRCCCGLPAVAGSGG